MFSKTEEPLDADDWLQTMENNLEVAGVEAAEKVVCHPLPVRTCQSLVDKCPCNECGMMTWEDFKLKFSKYHVPQGLIKKMRDEFRELKQGRMSVVEYRDRFLTLSRYAPDETDTNEKRKERFLNGLHDEMKTVLVNIPFADLEALVDSAIQMEGKLHQANENRKRRMMNQNGPHHTQKYRNNATGGFTPRYNKPTAQTYRPSYTNNNGGPPKTGGNHNNSHNNNNHPNSNNNNGNNNLNNGPRTGSNAIPVTPKDKSTITCYECGTVGHYSNECHKKLAKTAPNTAAPASSAAEGTEQPQRPPLPHECHRSSGSTAGHAKLTVCLHWEAKLMGRGAYTRMEPNNTKFYQLGNGGSLIFERDLDALSEFLGRPHPEFHGVEVNTQPGELQWVITADLRGKMEPPTSERILFSIRESNWLDGLARALQEALARLCGHNVVAIQDSRFSHLARHDATGGPMSPSSHPVLKYHVEHVDFMLHETQKELDNARVYANQTHLHLAEHADAIKMLAKDRKSLRQQRAKKDATIARLRAKIVLLEATVKAKEDQLREMEEDGEDLQGGEAFLSEDDDFEEDENTDVEDYEFMDAGEDDFIPIDVDDEE
ncbi:hypothetical protein QYE76_000145 [Lolium multiflorum]|uniref:CCHC-type domain-containing protein n=1 Tax=Lolium multiflorum TaxID=4521 RepID=A0AAD8VVP7_LOLMU|nr:hypothetical protein QYE76_000145 [Lolium multiflorum]